MKKISGIFLALLTFFSSTLNVFADTIEVIEEKTQTINKEDYESLKEQVEKKVFDLNESDDEYIYDYEISITEEKDETIITETKKVTSEQKFTSEEDAKKFYDEYELEDSWKQGELSITSKQEDVVVNGDKITITCQDAACADEIAALEAALNEYQELEVISKNTTSKDDKKTIVYTVNGKEQELHYEDALKLVATLNPDVEGYTLVKNEYILVKKGSVDTKTFKELVGTDKYETYAEAKAAADKFLENDDYEDKVAVIVAVYDETEKETIKNESIGFLDEETALAAALAQATIELEQAIADGKLTIETTIEETKKALEKAYETGKLGLTGLELDGKIVYYTLPELRQKNTTEIINQTFYSKTGADLAVAALERLAEELEGTGVSIQDITLTETNTETTTLTTGVEVPGYKGTYGLIPSSDGYYSLEKGNSIVIWTVNALSAQEKEEISNSLKENNDKIKKVHFVTGYNEEQKIEGIGKFTFNKETVKLPFIGETSTYTITVNGEGTTVKTGLITTGKKYELSYKTVTTTELWYYDRTEIKYGFDYTVQGGGVTITRDLFKVQSILAGKIYDHTMAYRVNTTDTYTSYVASFDVYKEETKTNATVAYKITKEKAATGNVNPDNGDQITPPNTGAEVNFLLPSVLMIGILAAIVSLKKLCK